jgi:hypothetical protein
MRDRFAVAPLALLAAVSAVPAAAAICEPEAIAGLWVGHATVEKDLYCLVDVKASGAVKQSSCFDPKTLKPVATLDGKLTLSTDCKVKGTFEFVSGDVVTPAKFKGVLKTKQQTMTGDFVIFGEGESYRFVRQLD